MLRWLATIGILALLVLAIFIPETSLGRRGTEKVARADVDTAIAAVGRPLPDFEVIDFAGDPFRISELRGHRVLLTFERSVDW